MQLFRRRQDADDDHAARAAALSSWAASHGWQYVDTFPATRSVLLARGERNQLYDLVTGQLVAGLDSQLFTHDWITSFVDNTGVRQYHHHPTLALRVQLSGALAVRYLCVEPAHRGALGHARDRLLGPRHHNAKEIEVAGLEDQHHVHCLENDDPDVVRQLLSPSLVSAITGAGDDAHPLAFFASGSEAMIAASGLKLEPARTSAAEWLIRRAAPFVVDVASAARADTGRLIAFTGPLVSPERPGDSVPPPSFTEQMLGRATRPPASTSIPTITTTGKVTASFQVRVPAAASTKVKSALEEWLSSRGVQAHFSEEPQGATVLLRLSTNGDGLHLTDPAVQEQLRQVLTSALKP
jgi:hypothetical protein